MAALVFAPLAASAAEPPPLLASGGLPDSESMALSNDGSRLTAVMTIGGERVVLREEDHWLSRPATRLQMPEQAVAFVAERNPPD